ncbi:uncharacterized protein LOC135162058 [Diachasmimorpha longicaudata]|uniref:uncharacterized protein LOC135162058 n=1 Tax=Diachasmimorpha longicaudata TaxID=58733 RepID=UPI0030B87E92
MSRPCPAKDKSLLHRDTLNIVSRETPGENHPEESNTIPINGEIGPTRLSRDVTKKKLAEWRIALNRDDLSAGRAVCEKHFRTQEIDWTERDAIIRNGQVFGKVEQLTLRLEDVPLAISIYERVLPRKPHRQRYRPCRQKAQFLKALIAPCPSCAGMYNYRYIAGAFLSPKGILLNSKNPKGVKKAVLCLDLTSIGI